MSYNKYDNFIHTLNMLDDIDLGIILAASPSVRDRLEQAVEREAQLRADIERAKEEARRLQEAREAAQALDEAMIETDLAYQILLKNMHLLKPGALEELGNAVDMEIERP